VIRIKFDKHGIEGDQRLEERNITGVRAYKFTQQPERKSEEDPVDVLKMRVAKAKGEITRKNMKQT
jgi:hypothetical protein